VTRRGRRTAPCSAEDARARLRHAVEFLEVAELVLGQRVEPKGDDDPLNLSGVSAALAVLAGIAASDAATCFRLALMARGQDHREAVDLLATVRPHGPDLSKNLDRLLDLKDSAHYGVLGLSDAEAGRAVEWARRMVTMVRVVLGGV
jgi:hypothetical protein